jgi:hypothetical protein
MPEHTDCPKEPVELPGGSALREFCRVIEAALTLATPATMKDELTYLRISRDRARVVLFGCKRVLADHELDDRDLMAIVASLRDMITPLPADQYTPNSLTW